MNKLNYLINPVFIKDEERPNEPVQQDQMSLREQAKHSLACDGIHHDYSGEIPSEADKYNQEDYDFYSMMHEFNEIYFSRARNEPKQAKTVIRPNESVVFDIVEHQMKIYSSWTNEQLIEGIKQHSEEAADVVDRWVEMYDCGRMSDFRLNQIMLNYIRELIS